MSPRDDVVAYRFARSVETIEEAQMMADAGHWNACVNRLYYACFYAVSALLLTKELSSPKHTGVRSLFSLHFVKTGIVPKELAQLYNTLFDARQESDYEDFFTAEEDDAIAWLGQSRKFVSLVQQLLSDYTPGA